MQTSHKLTHKLLALLALLAFAAVAFGQAPPNAGLVNANPPSDQKPGSKLFYNIYTSTVGDNSQNTRFNLTNTHPTKPVSVHLFFVNRADCYIADTYFCLTANHTVSFLASEFDPGITGFMFAVATSATGAPISHNYLIGDEYVKSNFGTSTYFQANLNAVSFSARYLWDGTSYLDWTENSNVDSFVVGGAKGAEAYLAYGKYHDTTDLPGGSDKYPHFLYDEVPCTLAVDNIQSLKDGNQTLLILHSMQGQQEQAGAIGQLSGLVYNDTEKGFSYQTRWGCVDAKLIDDNLIRVPFGFSKYVIPSGKTGWMYLLSNANPAGIPGLGMMGATIVSNTNIARDKFAYNGGHNLHILQVAARRGFAIPVFPTAECRNYSNTF